MRIGKAVGWLLCGSLMSFVADAHAAEPDDAITACPVRKLEMDIEHLKSEADVQSVMLDPAGLRATVLYRNGDVLRVGTIGCMTPMIAARLWVVNDEGRTDQGWMARARTIAQVVLTTGQFSRVDAALQGAQTVIPTDTGFKFERALAGGAGYSVAVLRAPHDSLGPSLSAVFSNL
ncbi:hypothetical protein ACN9MB_21885 [Dyella kyungheensis]|uniref:hypothetical protein n=1 Tax=Dyella kyungheensis TaxID=1242174 RepID=UPI003CE8CF52